jgi:hypothetical protein
MLSVHENACLVTNPDPPSCSGAPPPLAVRGRVTTFSRASRRRLRRLLSVVQWSQLPPARFVTLTLHRVPDDWHRRFAVWLQWLRDSGASYIWRLELQARGAPHWHVILWCTDSTAAGARAAWHRTAAAGSRAHQRYGFHVTQLESYRQAAVYVSKYVAKVASGSSDMLHGHRHWGASRSLPTAPHAVAEITARQYDKLRRIARRLIRSRNRTRRARQLSPARFHLFCSQRTAAQLCTWLGLRVEPPPPPHRADAALTKGQVASVRWNGARWVDAVMRSGSDGARGQPPRLTRLRSPQPVELGQASFLSALWPRVDFPQRVHPV